MNFGDNLRNLRKSKKLSQEDLAEKVNVSRQSVSKWETGDAYPEMNNILELCKIFHCHINDLVNDSIIDIESLDEEIRMNVVKFKGEQQRKMKGLSKAISIIAKIGKIACMICLPMIIVSMIASALIINKVNITENKITLNGNDIIEIVNTNGETSILINNKKIEDKIDQEEINKLESILHNNSKLMTIVYIETGFAFLVVCLVLIIIMLKDLENLFTNINRGDTPFTLENVGYIKKIAYLMIIVTVLPNIIGGIFEIFLNADLNVNFEVFSIIEILFLFSLAYIFQYGYEIQLDSKGKMYGDEHE